MRHSGERTAIPDDTSARAWKRYMERLRQTPPRQRLERALRLSEQVRDAAMSDVRRQNPLASQPELAVAFVRRVYGDRLAQRLATRFGLS